MATWLDHYGNLWSVKGYTSSYPWFFQKNNSCAFNFLLIRWKHMVMYWFKTTCILLECNVWWSQNIIFYAPLIMQEKFPGHVVLETDCVTMASKLQVTLLDITLVHPIRKKATTRTWVRLCVFLSSFFQSAWSLPVWYFLDINKYLTSAKVCSLKYKVCFWGLGIYYECSANWYWSCKLWLFAIFSVGWRMDNRMDASREKLDKWVWSVLYGLYCQVSTIFCKMTHRVTFVH